MEQDPERRLCNIIEDTYDRLFSAVSSLCKDEDQCKDILQETYIRLWKNLPGIKDDASVISLLKQYARNVYIDELRKKARLPFVYAPGADASVETFPFQRSSESKLDLLHKAVSKLPKGQQEIFLLRLQDTLSYKQIAGKLGIAVGTVETQMNRAIKFLRQEVSKSPQEFDQLFFSALCLAFLQC